MLIRSVARATIQSRHCLVPPSLSSFRSSWFRSCSNSPSTFAKSPEEAFVEEHLTDSETAPSAKISIDRSGLYNPPEHSHGPSSDSRLVKHLKDIIKFRGGPITVAEYMEEVLTNPIDGFYINRDVFGAEGDFITSPEVSQMFGEMIGVWVMCLWEQMGRPSKVNLVELGPGRGTLLADLLRGTSNFKNFSESLHLHLVECSPALRKIQYNTLKCEGKDDDEQSISSLAGTPISWHATVDQIPSGIPSIFLAHEFFDALPIHQFQKASSRGGWCEKVIDIDEENSQFRFALSPQPTPTLLYLLKRCKWADTKELANINHMEICPKAMDLCQTITKRISSDGGGALIIDYGLNSIVSDSLQAIRKHKFVNILDNPGSADLSAYVDFPAIRHSAEEVSEDISVHGPMTQSQFLGSLGINFRVEALLEKCTEEQADSLRSGYWRLVGEGEAPFWEGEEADEEQEEQQQEEQEEQQPEEQEPIIGMGTRYLVMAIVNKKQGVPVPFQ